MFHLGDDLVEQAASRVDAGLERREILSLLLGKARGESVVLRQIQVDDGVGARMLRRSRPGRRRLNQAAWQITRLSQQEQTDLRDMSARRDVDEVVLAIPIERERQGEVVKPFFSPAGLELIVRCDAASPEQRAFELPTREELRQQLFSQRMSIYAKSYLQELRRSAVVSAGGN